MLSFVVNEPESAGGSLVVLTCVLSLAFERVVGMDKTALVAACISRCDHAPCSSPISSKSCNLKHLYDGEWCKHVYFSWDFHAVFCFVMSDERCCFLLAPPVDVMFLAPPQWISSGSRNLFLTSA